MAGSVWTNRLFTLTRCASVATIAILLHTQTAAAQSATNEQSAAANRSNEQSEPSELSEIVVSAQKRNESIKDVPIAVVAISASTLTRDNVFEIQDLPRLTAGLLTNSSAAYRHDYIRGVGSEFNIPGVNPSVSIYVDGIVQQSSQASPPFLDVERVEVLKGPQGTLFGRNTPGGAINIITRPAPDKFEAQIAVTGGNLDNKTVSFAVGGPVSDVFRVGLAGYYSDKDAYLKNLNPAGPPIADTKKYGGRIKLDFGHTDGPTAELVLKSLHSEDGDAGAPTGVLAASQNAALGGSQTIAHNRVFSDTPFIQKYTENGASLVVRVPTPFFDFVSLSGYTRARAPGGDDGDGGSRPTALGPVAWFALNSEEDTFSQEFQLVSNGNDKLKWLAGLYYFNDRGAIASLSFPFAPGIVPGPPDAAAGIGNFRNALRYKSYAAFGQARYSVTDAFGITLGGRYTKDEVALGQFISNFGPPGPGPASISNHDFSPKLSLDYKLGPALFYVTASKGYKSGGYSLSTMSTATLLPEENRAVELGVKADISPEWYVELSAFKYHYKNIQTTVNPSSTDPTELINAPLSEIYGLDFSSVLRVTHALQLSTGWSFLPKANFVDFPQAPGWIPNGAGLTAITASADGKRMQHVPRISGNAGATYDVAMPDDALLRSGVNVSYMGKYEGDPQNYAFDRQGGYALLDANLTYSTSGDRWSVEIWGKNLADKNYYLSEIPSAALVFGWQGEPRTFGITLRAKY